MNEQQRQRIVARHRDALLRHGLQPAALYWSSREIQETRFRVLAEIGLASGCSVLDVGCGFGDLARYLAHQGLEFDYTGIDLSPDLIQAGRGHDPRLTLLEGDIFDLPAEPERYDYVLLSGALNENLADQGAYAFAVIERMFELCRVGVAFNLLDARNAWIASRPDLQSHQPDTVLAFCRGLTAHCQLRDDYLDNDFTVYLRR